MRSLLCAWSPRRAVDLVREEAALDARSRVGDDAELFEELRDLRRELAEEHQVPACIICSDATLRGMCRKRPATRGELLEVSGIGEKKAGALWGFSGTAVNYLFRESGIDPLWVMSVRMGDCG